ncbi:MAG: Gfo/Idh/MocA family oxidoreductase [Phycisphaerae bacterium]
MKKLNAVLIGAGARGSDTYSHYGLQFPHKLRYVAVAEPDATRRQKFADQHGIPPEHRFASWEDLMSRDQLAEAAFVVTADRLHFSPTVALLEKGYHVLVEKPMSVDPVECLAMVWAAEKFNRILSVGHVLRFVPFYQEIQSALHAGKLGQTVNITQMENVGFWHFAHSFVRREWGRSDLTAPSILAKCCHDLDILRWLMNQSVRGIASVGNLFQFRPDRAPGPVPERCTDGCPFERECPYSALRLYVDPGRFYIKKAFHAMCELADAKDPYEYLKQTFCSRCVYRSGNDVCDQQVVTMEFTGGSTATLTMMAHTRDDTRTIRISGTRGELHGNLVKNDIRIRDFLTDKLEQLTPEWIDSGHMGGDIILIDQFIESVENPSVSHLSSARESLESHLLAFAAEKARIECRYIHMEEFTKEIGKLARTRFLNLAPQE